MISAATSSTAVYNQVKCKALHLLVYFKHPVTVTSQHMLTSYSNKHILPIVSVMTEVALATKLQGGWDCSSNTSLFLRTLPTCFGFCRYQAGRQRHVCCRTPDFVTYMQEKFFPSTNKSHATRNLEITGT